MKRQIQLAAACAAVAAALAGCQTTPPINPDLEAARSAVAQVRSNPAAARAASVEVENAQQALRRAETAWADRRDNAETQHLSYLARRRAEIAQTLATQAQAEDRMKSAGDERERARLRARTREAEAATQAARQAQASAQVAQGQAAASRQDAEAARLAAAQQAERAAALERDLLAVQARSTQRGMVVTLGDVLFATGQATLQPGAQRSAQQIAAVLKQYPERRVLVEGFTDSQGSDSLNLDLSQRRAEAFRQALGGAGVSQERVEFRGHGKAFPVADNGNAAGRQANRRVEVLFSNAEGRFTER